MEGSVNKINVGENKVVGVCWCDPSSARIETALRLVFQLPFKTEKVEKCI